MPEAWATCEAPGCNSNCGSSERYCAVHKDAFNTGEPMEIAWQLLKAWPDPPEEDEKERFPTSHLPLQHPARKRHRGQAARTGGIEGLEGTMPPEFGSDIDEQNKIADDFHDAEQKWRDFHREGGDDRDEHRGWRGEPYSNAPSDWGKLFSETKDALEPVYEGKASDGYERLPGKKDKRPELEPFEREEALADRGAEMPDPHESEPPEGEPPESDLESAWKEITGSGGTAADELEEHLRPAEEKEQQAQEEESQLNEMARQMGEKAGDYFTESAERSEPNTYANMTTDELKDAYIPMAQQYDSMSDEEREADPDFMEELEKVRQALRSAEWEEGQNKPPVTQSTRARPTRGGRRGNVKVQPRRGTPRRYTRGE
jgi:hypothetical protein